MRRLSIIFLSREWRTLFLRDKWKLGTAHLDEAAGSVKVLGNPTEGALLLWLADRGVDYAKLRRHAEVIEQLTFSTERDTATVVQSPLLNHRVLYVKGAPNM